LNSSDF